jgi:Ca-activated chloride channel homolog
LSDVQNDVAKLIYAINNIEGELRDTRMVDVSANRYQIFLLLGLILLVMDVMLNIKTVRI